jgi:hypothetical protein
VVTGCKDEAGRDGQGDERREGGGSDTGMAAAALGAFGIYNAGIRFS